MDKIDLVERGISGMKNNLGGYKVIVQLAKKLGGPINLAGATLLAGYGFGKGIETGVKAVGKHTKKHKIDNSDAKKYEFSSTFKFNRKLTVVPGTVFTIVEKDKNMVLISIEGDKHNPYVFDTKILKGISNYR